jgi:hypothetical protein
MHLKEISMSITSDRFRILSLPARSAADEIAAMKLAEVLETKSCFGKAVSVTALTREMDDAMEQHKGDIICVSATPPEATMHARYLCKRLRRRFPQVKLVVGLWETEDDLDKAREHIGCDATVVSTMADAQEQIRVLIKELSPKTETQWPTEGGQMIRPRPHPSHYRMHVDVQSSSQHM